MSGVSFSYLDEERANPRPAALLPICTTQKEMLALHKQQHQLLYYTALKSLAHEKLSYLKKERERKKQETCTGTKS